MKMCEILHANVLLEKFSSSWSDYRNYLKHKMKDISFQELISHKQTKEANYLKGKFSAISYVHWFWQGQSCWIYDYSNADKFNNKMKITQNFAFQKNQNAINKIQKKKICYVSVEQGIKLINTSNENDNTIRSLLPMSSCTRILLRMNIS